MTDKCQCYYTKSYEDDLGGHRSYQAPCGDPVHRAGRCLAHHKAHLHLLKCGIEYAKKKIHQDQIELIELSDDPVCSQLVSGASCRMIDD